MSSFIKADLCPIQGYLKRKGEESFLRLIIQVEDNGRSHEFDGVIEEQAVRHCMDVLTAYCNGTLQKNETLSLQECYSVSNIEITNEQPNHCILNILHCNDDALSFDEDIEGLFDDIGFIDDPNGLTDNPTETTEAEMEGLPEPVTIVPDFSCELSHDQICAILESFRKTLDGIDWDQYGKQPLFQFLTPKRDFITVYSILEMEAVVSQHVLGHRLEGIYVNFDYISSFSIDNFQIGNHSDADRDYFWDVILMFDHGILRLIPWKGSTIKLRFYNNNEYQRACIMSQLEGFDSYYYETKGLTTDSILHSVVESVKAIETHEYNETSLIERWNGTVENVPHTYRREPTALLFMMSNSKEVAFLTGDGEELWIRVQDPTQFK